MIYHMIDCPCWLFRICVACPECRPNSLKLAARLSLWSIAQRRHL